MRTKDGQEERTAEIRRLFAELEEIYDRMAALTDEPVKLQGQITEERRKATAVIRRIRDLQHI